MPAENAVWQRARDEEADVTAKSASSGKGDVARPRDTMLTALRSAEAGGGSFHLLGRPGHLEVLTKFDVAVSTACPALTYLVTETVDGAQKCIDFYAPTILVALLSSYLRKFNILMQNDAFASSPEGKAVSKTKKMSAFLI